jgi:hypothetical protein
MTPYLAKKAPAFPAACILVVSQSREFRECPQTPLLCLPRAPPHPSFARVRVSADADVVDLAGVASSTLQLYAPPHQVVLTVEGADKPLDSRCSLARAGVVDGTSVIVTVGAAGAAGGKYCARAHQPGGGGKGVPGRRNRRRDAPRPTRRSDQTTRDRTLALSLSPLLAPPSCLQAAAAATLPPLLRTARSVSTEVGWWVGGWVGGWTRS